ncbi:MAG: PAS domain-containing sensor histidine kinase [Chthoniobacteraceae bacterium]
MPPPDRDAPEPAPSGTGEEHVHPQAELGTLRAENDSLRAALKLSEARYRSLLHSGTNAVFRTNGAGDRMIEVSGPFMESAAVEPGGSAAGDWIAKNIHPDDAAATLAAWSEAMNARRPYQKIHRLLAPEGECRYAICRAVPMVGENGEVQEWIGTISDISEQKRAEEALRVSEDRLRLILENAREYAIISMDLDRRITSWNSGAEAVVGYSESEVLHQYGDLIFTPEDCANGVPEREAATALATGRASDERWHVRKDGSRFWASGVMTRMCDEAGHAVGLLKIMRDRTARLRTKEALEESRRELVAALAETERARAEAEAAGRAKDQFLAILSHELRTPLTPVLMAVHMLGRDPSLSETAKEALRMIQRNVQLEARFVDDLLDVTRITRGKMELVTERIDLHGAVLHAVDISRGDIEARGQQLTVALEAAEHMLEGDSERLQQVVWNLLKNASKFTPDGGSIHLHSWNDRGCILVEVRDTGLGFEPGAEDRIFEAFEQANLEVSRRFGGLGLGLAISKATVDAHGGHIWASSDGVHRGASFTIKLPLSAASNSSGEPQARP